MRNLLKGEMQMFNIKELYSNRIGGKSVSNKLKNENIRLNESIEEVKVLDFTNKAKPSKLDFAVLLDLSKSKDFDKEYSNLDFYKACSAYMKVERFVDLDYKSEIGFSKGIEEVMRILPLAFANKDDYIITATFNDNVLVEMVKYLDGKTYKYNLNKFNKYLIDFDDIDESILKKCKLLYINYPNNPTGVIANHDFFKEVIKAAKKYNFIVVNDASYIDFCFDEIDKLSFLSVEGAKDVGIEIYDMCKIFNINGVKGGFVAGNKEVIKVYKNIKSSMEIEENTLILQYITKRLSDYEETLEKNKENYSRRHNLVKEALESKGFKVNLPKAGVCQYVEIPRKCNGVSYESAFEFALWLFDNEKISVTPYDNEGHYIAIYLDFDTEDKEGELLVI